MSLTSSSPAGFIESGVKPYHKDQSILLLEYLKYLCKSFKSIAPGEAISISSKISSMLLTPCIGSVTEKILKFLLKVSVLDPPSGIIFIVMFINLNVIFFL